MHVPQIKLLFEQSPLSNKEKYGEKHKEEESIKNVLLGFQKTKPVIFEQQSNLHDKGISICSLL